jgi:hypothetical protein
MFKLGDLPDQSVLEEIRSIERDLEELKNAQRVGSSSLKIKYNQTGNTWDINETVSNSISIVRWRVTFTPDHGGVPYAELGYNYELTPADPFSYFESYPDPDYVGGSGVAFILSFAHNDFVNNTTVKAKCGIKCVDSGTLSFTKVYEV